MTDQPKKSNLERIFTFLSIAGIVSIFAGMIYVCCSCTTSVTTISSHGEASDMVDQDQSATADIKPNVSLPVR